MLTDSITDKFSRSWKLTKQTFAVMMHDKEILLLPVFGSIFSIILFIIFILPWFVGGIFKGLGPLFLYGGIFIFYFSVTFAAVFFNAGVVHIAKTRLEGGDATLKEGLGAGFKHIKQIISWSLLSATVGLLLNILQSQARRSRGIGAIISRIVISLIGLAWAIVSVFVVPAIVIKGYGPIDALKSSARTIKKTWGESLIRYYGLGLAKGLFSGVGFLVLLVPGVLMMTGGYWSSGLVMIGIFILYFMLLSIIFSAANTIFNTALFLYADTGKTSSFYSEEVLSKAFKEKPV